jgi:hypothetical protein
LTGSVIRTVVAATVPDESALPWAVTHLPTLTELAVVDASVVIFVLAPTVTVLLVVLLLPLAPLAPGVNCREAITTVEPDTDVTDPAAIAPTFARCPDGNPDGNPDGRWPVPPPKPPVQLPFVAGLIASVAAVNDAADSDVPDGAIAVTQVPALIAASVAVTWSLNFVDVVHATAIWPDCGFCTCIVVPSMAATVPLAAGPRWPAPPGPAALAPPEPLGLAAAGDGDAGSVPPLPLPDELLHAVKVIAPVSATTAMPRADRATDEDMRNLLGFMFIRYTCSFAAQCVDG